MDLRDDVAARWRSGRRAEAIELARAITADRDVAVAALLDVADQLQALAEETGESPDADAAVSLATELRRRAWPPPSPQSVHASQGLVRWYAATGRLDRAEAELGQARREAEAHVESTVTPLTQLLALSAEIAEQAGRFDDAVAFIERAIALERRDKRRRADELWPLHHALSHYLLRAGRSDDAAGAIEAGLRLPRRGLSPSEEAEELARLAGIRERQGQARAAVPLIERALRLCQRELGPEHPITLRHRDQLARLRGLL